MSTSVHQHLSAREKEHRLIERLRTFPSILIGYSGGVDSAYLGSVAVEAVGAERALAVVGRSASLASEQWSVARAAAVQSGLPLLEVETNELEDPRYAVNPVNRCYFCKTELWRVLGAVARDRGYAVIVDGTNADDLSDYRPGAQAAAEHGVISPLADAGLSKDEIRQLSRARGLPTWANPAAPCLSSRLPYGTMVTPDRLRQVERAEQALRALGLTGDLRVRHHGDLARVELPADTLARWLSDDALRQLGEAVREGGFNRVALDLRGFRSGSLNILEGVGVA
jgi:pyridinium-3,5-biscarboxylic acid mononucleotide sulfurtransferase